MTAGLGRLGEYLRISIGRPAAPRPPAPARSTAVRRAASTCAPQALLAGFLVWREMGKNDGADPSPIRNWQIQPFGEGLATTNRQYLIGAPSAAMARQPVGAVKAARPVIWRWVMGALLGFRNALPPP